MSDEPVPTELAAILAKVDLLTRMLPRDMQRDVFCQVIEAHRLGQRGMEEKPAGCPRCGALSHGMACPALLADERREQDALDRMAGRLS